MAFYVSSSSPSSPSSSPPPSSSDVAFFFFLSSFLLFFLFLFEFGCVAGKLLGNTVRSITWPKRTALFPCLFRKSSAQCCSSKSPSTLQDVYRLGSISMYFSSSSSSSFFFVDILHLLFVLIIIYY